MFRNIRTIVNLFPRQHPGASLFFFCCCCCSTPCYAISRQRWHNGSEIKSSANHFSSETSEVVSQLFIENVTREYYGSKFECRAQNSKVLSPVVKEILVQIHCKLLVFLREPSSSSLSHKHAHTKWRKKLFASLLSLTNTKTRRFTVCLCLCCP